MKNGKWKWEICTNVSVIALIAGIGVSLFHSGFGIITSICIIGFGIIFVLENKL